MQYYVISELSSGVRPEIRLGYMTASQDLFFPKKKGEMLIQPYNMYPGESSRHISVRSLFLKVPVYSEFIILEYSYEKNTRRRIGIVYTFYRMHHHAGSGA
jgi:hypothetical protein